MRSPEQLPLEAKFFKGFADASRLTILRALIKKSKTVSDLVEETGLSQPNTSAHLACLLECGIVQKEKRGREAIYQISMKEIAHILKDAEKIVKSHAKDIYNCTHY
jgi:DNA-binding transcriptional ArsR family regulator